MKTKIIFLILIAMLTIPVYSQTCQWAEKIAGNGRDYGKSIATDSLGNVYVAGEFVNDTITFNNGKTLSNTSSYPDVYIAKFNSSGVCQWAEKIAGTNSDYAYSIAVDGSGNIYVAGNFVKDTLTFNNGKTLSNTTTLNDVYIAKYNSNGTCQWAEKIAGTLQDEGKSMAVDGSGNVYVAGVFNSSTLTFNNGKTLSNTFNADAFIAKYNSNGVCQWAEIIAGTSHDIASSIAVDGSDNVYVAGYWFGSSTLTFNNSKTLSNTTTSVDAYIAKYNSNGICQWAEKIAGTSYDYANCITIDGSGNVYVAGYWWGSSTLTFNNSKTLSSTTFSNDAYIAKYNSNGTCQWAEKISGTSDEIAYSIAVDGSGNVYVAGNFLSTLTFNNGKTLSNTTIYNDIYIAKYNNSGVCQWAEKIAGTDLEYTYSIAVDGSSNVYVAGSFKSSTLTLNNGITLSNSGNYDCFIAKYNTTILATIDTEPVTNLTKNSASCGGNVTNDGGASVTARGVCWSTTQNPTTSNSKTTDGTGTGSFASSITALNPNTTYYVRAYATNSAGTAYGTQLTFTTLANLPTLSSTTISNITSTAASSGGNISSDGGATVTACGVCWATTQNPTTANSKTTDGTGVGSFTSSITALNPNTTYYLRAYATNSVGTAYGDELSFTTKKDSSNFRKLSFQGVLRNNQGQVIQTGTYQFTFKIYNVVQNGVALWSETKSITIVNGVINTNLGDVTVINLPFDTSYWLGIQVGTDTQELSPRRELTGTIYPNGSFGR